MAGQAVYWVGADKNVYLKAPQTDTSGKWTVTNMGPANGTGANGGGYPGAVQIADPNAPAAPPPVASTPAAPAKVFNQAGAENTQRTIDQIGPLLQAALASEEQNHQNSVNTFNQQEKTQTAAHDTGTVTNQQNYDSNFMDAIRAGIHGLGGLMALLRGTGAAGGTADKQVRDVVGGTTANDVRTGADTQKNNQGQLDSSLSTFLTDLHGKRQINDDTAVNNKNAIQRDSETQLQDLYGKMAGFYGDVGNTAGANDWMNRAGALTPDIAAHSHTQVSPYDTSPIVVHAPNLTAFAPPTQPDVAVAPPDGQVGSGIFTISNTKRKDQAAAPAPALAGA